MAEIEIEVNDNKENMFLRIGHKKNCLKCAGTGMAYGFLNISRTKIFSKTRWFKIGNYSGFRSNKKRKRKKFYNSNIINYNMLTERE